MGMSVWGTPTTIYERGTTNEWADADLTDWPCDYATPTISEGISVSTKNGGWACTKTISVTANAIVTLDATLKTGGASGRSGSYDYIKIGGVTIGFKEQDKVAFVDIDGTSSNLALAYTRNTAYDVQVVINQATGAVSYSVGAVSGSSSSTTAITNIVFGHSKAGKENYNINPILQKIKVQEEAQTVTTAGYTVKYVCGGDEIKTADTSRSGVVGNTVSLKEGDKASFKNDGGTKKYIYVSDDSGSNPVEGDGSTIITVTFREAATWNYTVNAMNGGVKIEEVATGSNFEGESVKVPFHKYYNIDGTLYSKDAISNEYNYSFTLSSDNQVENLAYTASSFSNVIFFSEAEDIATLTTVPSGGGVGIRCSYSSGAYADAAAVITTLTPGKYKLTGAGYGGNLVFSAGATEILNMPTAGYERETTSDEFEITTNTDITFIGGADNNAALDYVFIQQTAVPVEIKTTGTTFSSAYPIDCDALPTGVKAYKVTKMTASEVTASEVTGQVAANTGLILKADAAGKYDIPVVASGAAVEGNMLKAAVTDTEVAGQAYGLKDGKFHKLNAGTIPAGKAYLLASDITSAPELNIVFEGNLTGISVASATSKNEGVVYDLQGRKVANPTKGLYIQNGRKVILK